MRRMGVIHTEIDDDVHARAKAAAAYCHMTLKEFIEQALREKAEAIEAEQRKKRR